MPNATNKMKVSVDREKNRLYCSWSGIVSKKDLDSFFTDIRFSVEDLKPDFAIITDLSECHYCELAGIPVLQRIMQYLLDHGIKDIIRIVKDKSLIYTQISNLSLKKQGYIPAYVYSAEEAEQFLENLAKRNHIRLKMFGKEVKFKSGNTWKQGLLQDLSLSGCAITTTEDLPTLGQKPDITFHLLDKKKQKNQFTCKTEVTRIFINGFAVAFAELTGKDKKRLTECLGQALLDLG